MCHPAFRIYITFCFLLPLTFGCANNTDSTEAPLLSRKISDSIFLSQIEEYEQLKQKYPFIQFDLNRLGNDSALLAFFDKLDETQTGQRQKVNILHIGDSHIQADEFSGKVRVEMQKRFGNAGRGLVFPYKLARTNGPQDIDTYSNVSWESKRNVFPSKPIPIGISGISLKTTSKDFVLKIGIKDLDTSDIFDYKFNKITAFSPQGPGSFDFMLSECKNPKILEESYTVEQSVYHRVRSGEYLGLIANKYGTSVSHLMAWNGLRNHMIYPGQKLKIVKKSVVHKEVKPEDFGNLAVLKNSIHQDCCHSNSIEFDRELSSIFVRCVANEDGQKECVINGFLLENTQDTGVIYNMVGVNGAQYRHYNQSEYFMPQLQALAPDLVIISLGTNEALEGYFPKESFLAEMDSFVTNIRRHSPDAAIIITSPPDVYKKRRYKNENCREATETIIEYADSVNVGYWNLYEVMGGYGSIASWYNNRLAQADRIHFTAPGYQVQGTLLYHAILSAYDRFRELRPK